MRPLTTYRHTAGVRHALLSSVAVRPVTDLALAAMAVSVALEVGAFGLAAGAARLASAGAERAALVALDGAIASLYLGVFPAFGLSVAAASAAMIWSGAFRLWLPVLGLISGGVMMASGIVDAALYSGSQAQEGTIGPLGWMGAMIWMLATGVILLRRLRALSQLPSVPAKAAR